MKCINNRIIIIILIIIITKMVSSEMFRVEKSEWGTRFSVPILQRKEEY